LAKLRSEREKTDLDAADLRVPYKERAAFKTAIFQGRAAMVAVVAVLLSALSFKPLYDAFRAEQDEAIAKAQKRQSDDAKAAEDKVLIALQKEQVEIGREIQIAQGKLSTLNADEAEAKRKASLAEIDGILIQAGDSPDEDIEPSLSKSLSNSTPGLLGLRKSYLRSIASNSSRPALTRFFILKTLLDLDSHATDSAAIQSREDLKRKLLGLTGSPENDLYNYFAIEVYWPEIDNQFGTATAAFYACSYYSKLPEKGRYLGGPRKPAPFGRLAEYILLHYSDYPECFQQGLDALDPKYDREIIVMSATLKCYYQAILLRSIGSAIALNEIYRFIAGDSLSRLSEKPPTSRKWKRKTS